MKAKYNWEPGQPNVKLYVKNLPKTVRREDLEFLFGRYFASDEDAKMYLFSLSFFSACSAQHICVQTDGRTDRQKET
jgi:RNA recognition motif-containing protein